MSVLAASTAPFKSRWRDVYRDYGFLTSLKSDGLRRWVMPVRAGIPASRRGKIHVVASQTCRGSGSGARSVNYGIGRGCAWGNRPRTCAATSCGARSTADSATGLCPRTTSASPSCSAGRDRRAFAGRGFGAPKTWQRHLCTRRGEHGFAKLDANVGTGVWSAAVRSDCWLFRQSCAARTIV